MKMKAVIPLLVFIVLVILLGYGLTRDPKEIPSPLIGKPVPVFKLAKVLKPNENISNLNFVGQVSILNVWASWCASCRVEHPIIVEFAKKHPLNIYGFNYKDQRSDAIRWLKYYGDPYIASAYDVTGSAGIDWGVYGVPETFIIDKKGIIRYKKVGPMTKEFMENTLLPLLKKLENES